MAGPERDLVVRRHERIRCALGAEVWIEDSSLAQVRIAGAARNTAGAVPVTIFDCSDGGVGLLSPVFLPPACHLRLRAGEQPVEVVLTVQRATMTDRRPTYYLGTSFVSVDSPAAARIIEMAGRARAEEPARA